MLEKSPIKHTGDLEGRPVIIITYMLLIVSRMNHEVALWMLTYRAEFRSLLADNYVAAV